MALGKPPQPQKTEPAISLRLPADRTAGLLRIVLLLPAGALLLFVAARRLGGFDFTPSPVSSWVVELSWAFLALAGALVGLILSIVGLRWLVYAAWPGRMGLTITGQELEIALGPFGRRRLDLARMTAVYRFEMDDAEGTSTEDFLEPEDEIANNLPTIHHPDYPMSLNRILQKYIAGQPHDQLRQLRPLVDSLRDARPTATTQLHESRVSPRGAGVVDQQCDQADQ